MPRLPTAPGVYVEEIGGRATRTIAAVSTATTAFVGRAVAGPVNEPVPVGGFAAYQTVFGGLWRLGPMGHAVQHYFANGGESAVIVRVVNGGAPATHTLAGRRGELVLVAANPGTWGGDLYVEVTHPNRDPSRFDLVVGRTLPGAGVQEEVFPGLSVIESEPDFVATVLARRSQFLRVEGTVPSRRPNAGRPVATTPGDDGIDVGPAQISATGLAASHFGLWALDRVDNFDLLCIPPFAPGVDVDAATWSAALGYCEAARAMLILDPPSAWQTSADAEVSGRLADPMPGRSSNAALFFPRLVMPDPLTGNADAVFVPSGAVAGVFARTDAQRGVWKAPAGRTAIIAGATGLAQSLSQLDSGALTRQGINAIRDLPGTGIAIWGARTTAGSDTSATDWRYIPVRRLALFVEKSLHRGTAWAVFEANGEALWTQLRTAAVSFMDGLFRDGAFQGPAADEAYFVRCDARTTTPADVAAGFVHVDIGFAPLRPAEFVTLRISQQVRTAS